MMRKKIFIVGTGRSGTHWLGNILGASPEIKETKEKKPIFGWVTNAALDYNKRKKLLPFILAYYRTVPAFTKEHFLDKSHPNIWLVEHLNKNVANAYFIGIIRNPHATVASMLLHKGVLKWIENWDNYHIPNEFLGINHDNIIEYNKMPLEAKCTMRWIAHKKRLLEINKKLSQNFLLLNYENFFTNMKEQLCSIEFFLELNEKLPIPDIKKDSKLKWKNNLTEKQIKIINETLETNGFPDYVEKIV
ncbi:sulfotransferase [Flexistipes sinusarabici DSM 4947]|uniref:Sulfotransferase n=1 Tax=Flexistipes sinusarabici (strain ATCC 49648 / DSM 4947 / MAS 10) TaxID=717231 RepID=F8E8J7_FLESM|nr:sulfotransferase [Flexistipes sinusarabici]AEI14046.1 sulfotransferase [Flexistipes sinusarabici DSM 4947]